MKDSQQRFNSGLKVKRVYAMVSEDTLHDLYDRAREDGFVRSDDSLDLGVLFEELIIAYVERRRPHNRMGVTLDQVPQGLTEER